MTGERSGAGIRLEQLLFTSHRDARRLSIYMDLAAVGKQSGILYNTRWLQLYWGNLLLASRVQAQGAQMGQPVTRRNVDQKRDYSSECVGAGGVPL